MPEIMHFENLTELPVSPATRTENHGVGGSIPPLGTNKLKDLAEKAADGEGSGLTKG